MSFVHGPTFMDHEERELELSFARDQIKEGGLDNTSDYAGYMAALETIENFGKYMNSNIERIFKGEAASFERK